LETLVRGGAGGRRRGDAVAITERKVFHFLLIVCAAAFAYQVLAIIAAWRHARRRVPKAAREPGVSILKPVHGLDPNFREAIRSHARQEYPSFEILFGVADPRDPAVTEIRRLAAEFPAVPIRLIHTSLRAPNEKVGVLQELAAEARHSVLLVNDSDIQVPPGYLRDVVAPLEDARVGMVTCLYRARAESWPGRLEALGVATDFAPGVLVAPLVGVREFGLGSTLVFRHEQLRAVGGFSAVAGYLADDYQLARRLSGLGLRVHLSRTVVETSLAGATWGQVWRHQVRWHRTIRVSKGKGYLGLPVTQATLWSMLAAASGFWWLALPLIAVRMIAGLAVGWGVLRCPLTRRYFFLIPLRDLLGSAVWVAGLLGRSVEWRGRKLRLSPDGRILDSESP